MKHLSRTLALLAVLAILAGAALAVNPGSAQAASRGEHWQHPPAPAGTGCSYYVRYGDTLYGIALRYGISYYQLAQMNALVNPNWIYSGQRLNVPCGSWTPPVPSPGDYGLPICSYYTVRPGDWIYLIAARFGTSWTAIAKVNSLSNPNWIYPGMRLAIPCS